MNKLPKFIGATLVACSVGAISATAQSENSRQDWRQQAHCVSVAKQDAPSIIMSSQVQIIGVDIGREGEILRMKPKAHVYDALPTSFNFENQKAAFEALTRDDFDVDDDLIPETFKTPLDVTANKDASFVYILLPKSWSYSYPAMTMKRPAEEFKHPYFLFPSSPLSGQVAVVHQQGITQRTDKTCRYLFNLNVTITQEMGGRILKTPIIIDPESSTGDGGGWNE